jgi:peptidoglycan hydrolase-like protein with peptidoglycan-binding domain
MAAAVLAGGAAIVAEPSSQSAQADTANVTCAVKYSSVGYPSTWKTIHPIVPVTSAGNTDCLLADVDPDTTNTAVSALQNALAFSDYNLQASPAKWEYAGLLNNGSGALAANNWGIDGIFGINTYKAVKAFQHNHSLVKDGTFGNDTRSNYYLLFGENNFDSNYKYQARGVFKYGSTWYTSGVTRTYAY